MKKNRMTVGQVRQMIETELEVAKSEVESARKSFMSLETLQSLESAQTRMKFCKGLLKKMSVNRK